MKSYLRVALLGLRRLPLGKEFSSNEDFALHGLARWAAARNPAKKDFIREWRVLEGDFPRSADFWPPRVEASIASTEQEIFERTQKSDHPRKTFPAAPWWREDVDRGSRKEKQRGARSAEPPRRERHEEILRSVAQPFAKIKTPLDQLIVGHRRYADATGDVFYLVRTACNIGMRLIENGPSSELAVRGETAVRLASLAFDYDPANVFAWSLLRDALDAAGRSADAELVGWEAIRRFPEGRQWRNQLATVLAESLKRPEEAAAVLREGVSIFPDDPWVRTQLATVLADYLNSKDEARIVLETAQHDGAANEVTTSLLEKLRRGQKLRSIARASAATVADKPQSEPTLDLPTAAARHALFRFEHDLADLASVRDLLDRHAPEAYLAYVGERTGARPAPPTTTFALAFEAAARKGSSSALRALIARARPLEVILIRQAIAALESRTEPVALGETDAGGAERVLHLVRGFANTNAPPPPQRLVLVRDMAASFLSTDVPRIAA